MRRRWTSSSPSAIKRAAKSARWPGNPVTAHWGVPDPAAVEGREEQRKRAFLDALRSLEARIKLFVSLPVEKLDRLALKREVDQIGRLRLDATEGRAS